MVTSGYSGTPLAQKLGLKDGQRVLTCTGGVLLALVVLTLPAIAQEEKLQRISEAEFSQLLSGCWEDGWRATFIDGTEDDSSSSICFENDGGLSFTYELNAQETHISPEGEGTYEVANDRLHLRKSGGAEWPFPATEFDCDAFVNPRESLTLSDCSGAGPSVDNRQFGFVWDIAANPPTLSGCWEMRDSATEIERKVEDPFYASYVSYCFDEGAPGQLVVRAAEFNGYRDEAGNWRSAGGDGWDDGRTYEIVGDLLRTDNGQSTQVCELELNGDVLMLVDCFIENTPVHDVIENEIFDRART